VHAPAPCFSDSIPQACTLLSLYAFSKVMKLVAQSCNSREFTPSFTQHPPTKYCHVVLDGSEVLGLMSGTNLTCRNTCKVRRIFWLTGSLAISVCDSSYCTFEQHSNSLLGTSA